MSKHSSPIKTAHLGMPFGTAMHTLRKMIIFHMAQRLEEDFCFKCGVKIATVEELSVEHKVPWLHGDPSLFGAWKISLFLIEGATDLIAREGSSRSPLLTEPHGVSAVNLL